MTNELRSMSATGKSLLPRIDSTNRPVIGLLPSLRFSKPRQRALYAGELAQVRTAAAAKDGIASSCLPTITRMSSRPAVWTVGHSNHDLEAFIALVRGPQIDFLVDVRSYPYSRIAPHFNREELQAAIEMRSLRYLFLGSALGGRPQREDHYDAAGHALYGEMAAEPAFQSAAERLICGARRHRLALMCSCGRPDECHRRLLIGKVLCDRGAELHHILPNGRTEIEDSVPLTKSDDQEALFGHDVRSWRSARSVSHRRRLSTSSVD